MQLVTRALLVTALALSFVGAAVLAEDEKVVDPASADEVKDRWIHDDIEAGYAAAKESGKPLLIAFR